MALVAPAGGAAGAAVVVVAADLRRAAAAPRGRGAPLLHDEGREQGKRCGYSNTYPHKRTRVTVHDMINVELRFLLEKSPQLSRPLYTIINRFAFQGSSVECGLNTGCVKIFIDSEEMLMRKQREYGFEFSGQGRYSIGILDSYH